MAVLTPGQLRRALSYNTRRVVADVTRGDYVTALRRAVGLGAGDLDDAFAEALADWQEIHPASVRGRHFDGRLVPRTEAHLGIQLDEMERVARRAERYWEAGGIFYDSWSNDGRDNDLDGEIDEDDEDTLDGAHYGTVYRGFQVDDGDGGRRRIAPVSGNYEYRFCSDFVGRVLRTAGIIRGGYARVYNFSQGALNGVAYKFTRGVDYPEQYLRGDLIGHDAVSRRGTQSGHGAHIGIVVSTGSTNGGTTAPSVIDLPGPTSLRAVGIYREDGVHGDGRAAGVRGDVVREAWPHFRIDIEPDERQFLIRIVYSRLQRNSRRTRLPRERARG